MERTRFEIQLSRLGDGRTFARIFDEYWDGMDTATFDPAHPEEVNLKAFRELAAQLSNLKPGWYGISIDNYPFGKATRVFRIPGRHLRYVKAR